MASRACTVAFSFLLASQSRVLTLLDRCASPMRTQPPSTAPSSLYLLPLSSRSVWVGEHLHYRSTVFILLLRLWDIIRTEGHHSFSILVLLHMLQPIPPYARCTIVGISALVLPTKCVLDSLPPSCNHLHLGSR
ncbi:hypothetical protein OE88DRAFT_1289117 [Heliocybe sulcata]|uniref:Secreted protein n=1 Tax=Heliocybe sulcata TaxID=5364 RepID=A0A5C3N7Z4_9AGAM|nr:hypothetical protein OE88DRAFT_1289117 [Heliocybe sulcata]